MHINNLKINNFRSLLDFNLEPSKINILVGKNASGKTSVLEAIYFLAYTKSYKSDSKDLINFDNEFLKVIIDNLQIISTNNQSSHKKDGIDVKRKVDFVGNLLVLLYSPTDNSLINSEPSKKRRFINMTYGSLDRKYLDELNAYNQLIKERNFVLKESKDKIMLEIIDEQLIYYHDIIKNKRQKFIDLLNESIPAIQSKISNSNEDLKIQYFCEDNIRESLKKSLSYDLITGVTSKGIHRDNIKFLINGIDASIYASTGQVRTILLSLNLALVKIIKELKKEYPILLLDDIFSEIDDQRSLNFIKELDEELQIFVTTTNIDDQRYFLDKEIKIIKMSKGKIMEDNNGE